MPHFTRQIDFAAMHPNDLFHHRKPNARARDTRSFRGFTAYKFFEYTTLLLGRNSNTFVSHTKNCRAILAVGLNPHSRSVRRVFHSVFQQVANDPTERFPVRFDEKLSAIRCNFDLVPVRAGMALILFDAIAYQFRKIQRLQSILAASRIHASEIQEVFHELVQPRGFLLQDVEVAAAAALFMDSAVG